jgi:uncharacterized protein
MHLQEEPMLAHERLGVDAFVETLANGNKQPHLRVSWDAYFSLIDDLIIMIADNDWTPDQIVAITFGGVVPARTISEALDVPLAYFAAESYQPSAPGDRRNMAAASTIRFDRHLLRAHPGFGSKVLIVDDLADTGRTFATCVDWLTRHAEFGGPLVDIKTAALWEKEGSAHSPTYVVDFVNAVDVEHDAATSSVEAHYATVPLDAIRKRRA